MILIKLNEINFEYDIQSLIKAFYPEENLVTNRETEANLTVSVYYMRAEDISSLIKITLQSEHIAITDSTEVDFEDRKETKNKLKHLLYRMLTQYTGRSLPWGTLTGIRPTKIPVALLEADKNEEEIKAFMKETYLADDEKINLSIRIARKEIELLSNIDYKKGYSLYLGIPFCPSTCLYCSFPSHPYHRYKDRVDEYLEALCKEIEFAAEFDRSKVLNTVYIGGGTPTTLSPEQLALLLGKLRSNLDFRSNQEFTVEAGRPDSITKEKLQVMKQFGVTRISINPQTMKQSTLDLIGRRHTVEQTVEAFRLARECGFDNINMDFIVGLPEESIEDVRDTMEQTLLLKPDSITIHSLAVKRAARLNTEKELYSGLNMINNDDIMRLTAQYAEKMGLEPYYLYRQKNMTGNQENVGYSVAGKEGLYNILIMEEKQPILALGAGASTKMVFPDGERIQRIENVKDVTEYLNRTEEMIERKKSFLQEHQI